MARLKPPLKTLVTPDMSKIKRPWQVIPEKNNPTHPQCPRGLRIKGQERMGLLEQTLVRDWTKSPLNPSYFKHSAIFDVLLFKSLLSFLFLLNDLLRAVTLHPAAIFFVRIVSYERSILQNGSGFLSAITVQFNHWYYFIFTCSERSYGTMHGVISQTLFISKLLYSEANH